MKKFYLIVTSFSIFLLPSITIGQETASDVADSLRNVANFMQSLLLGLATLFILISAYKYMFAAGDLEKIKDAKKMLVYTIIAMIVAIIAGGFVPLVQDIIPAATE